MKRFEDLKERVWKCNMELFEKNLVVHTFGNVSGIDRKEGIIAIKPSGVSYKTIKPEDIVLVDFDNKIIEGKLKPSTDFKTHLVLYKSYKNIGGVAHTHSPFATAWAQAKKNIPCFGTTHADHIQGDIPCTKDLTGKQISGDYETETGNQIVEKLSDSENPGMILVAGHGPFTWGINSEQAVYNTMMLEEIAKIAWYTIAIDPNVKPISK
ncbi:MAG TPA: L-ribulose-5-phosphate 4-epimerase AraD, partial [Ignavibacteriaceae bacterium]|nr:L-ribulose-5-phosphate 4-epimerase AraD [Ignavibacteriaceae bacterium]